jgi:hypothetical protein
MKETNMKDWQLTQLFLSDTGVHEVYVDQDSKKLYCSCEGYQSRAVCKHTRFVTKRMSQNDGIYPVEISNKAPQEELTLASLDPSIFRNFLVKYGKIEVL